MPGPPSPGAVTSGTLSPRRSLSGPAGLSEVSVGLASREAASGAGSCCDEGAPGWATSGSFSVTEEIDCTESALSSRVTERTCGSSAAEVEAGSATWPAEKSG